MKKSQGFTLIELLVVIAVIGILASVVLASLNTARQKGSDAAVKGAMANLRAQAALDYDSSGSSYAGSGYATATTTDNCSGGTVSTAFYVTDVTAKNMLNNIKSNDQGGVLTTCSAGYNGFAVVAPLKGGGYWCVDSAGYSGTSTGSLGSPSLLCQ